MEHIRYKKETEVVTFQGKEITLENLSPVFTPEQEAVKRRELEQQLYEVFRKYADKRQKEEAGGIRFSKAIVDLRSCWRYNETVSSSVSFLRKGATI